VNVAVITMTRDRLDYTQHCFASLEQNAGCEYTHYVLDQRSHDGTIRWLTKWQSEDVGRALVSLGENIGICRGANFLLGELKPDNYDVIVRYDNDCEVTQPDTLKTTAELAATYGAIVSPRVSGLLNPPPTLRTVSLGGHLLDETAILGGIFMAIPSQLFWEHGFRYDENAHLHSGDEAIVPWWRARGGVCGYLQGYSVTHYETTSGQRERYPDYFARKDLEAVC
jgi:hypothetical protein